MYISKKANMMNFLMFIGIFINLATLRSQNWISQILDNNIFLYEKYNYFVNVI